MCALRYQEPSAERWAAWAGAWRTGQCEVCRAWCQAGLCPACVTRFAPPTSRCHRCAVPLPGAAATCGACIQTLPLQTHAVAAWSYAFPWDGLVVRFKRGDVALAGVLAAHLARAVEQAAHRADGPRAVSLPDCSLPDCILPVPLAPARLRERGYNQAWELARRVGRRLGRTASPHWLERVVDTPHQRALSRSARLANLRGAFAVTAAGALAVRGRHVAVVDDVMTTGATVAEVARTLLQAGAARVDAWVLARTPLD